MIYDGQKDKDQTQPCRVELYFEQLRGEIVTILANDDAARDAIRRLENELSVYKRAYADLDAERQHFERLKQDADKRREALENQLKGHRIVALVDGDGTIFNPKLVSQGQQGGHAAAKQLSDSIIEHLVSNYGANHYQLYVYVFLSKRGLADAFGRAGFVAAKAKFDEFITGFNQAAERFMMLDVGSAKEGADTKIKALLEDEIRLPQTEKIIFGGCHDNGYVTTLRSQITAGLKHKLVLLPGYSDMATGFNELELPSFDIPELFIPQKLTPISTNPHTQPLALPLVSTSPKISQPGVEETSQRPSSNVQQGFDALPFASVDGLEMSPPKEHPVPLSYSSAVQARPKRPATPDRRSNSSSDLEDNLLIHRPSTRSRLIDPNKPLSKHNPPPCTLFYLSNCKHGADCKYAHDYILGPEQFQEIHANAKRSPCPSRNKGEVCAWGDDCCYGHYCPMTTKCHFNKQRRCKFVGVDMHREPKA